MKRSKGRIYLSAFLAVVILVFGYAGWRYVSYTQALKRAQEQYVLPAAEPETNSEELEPQSSSTLETAKEVSSTTSNSSATATSKEPKPVPGNTTTTPSKPACTTKSTNILVLGIDTGEPYNRRPRSDTVMIYSLQPCKSRIVEVSVPRDSRVEVPGHGLMNINRAFEIGGAALSKQTIEKLFDIRIDRVVVVDFAGFAKLINAIGGITLNVEQDFNEKYAVETPIPTGRTTLNGQQALVYVRARRSDIERVQRQQEFVKALYEQVKAKKAYLTLANFILDNPDVILTNFSASEILSMAQNAETYSHYKLETIFLRGKATSIDGLSTWILNKEDIQNVHVMLAK